LARRVLAVLVQSQEVLVLNLFLLLLHLLAAVAAVLEIQLMALMGGLVVALDSKQPLETEQLHKVTTVALGIAEALVVAEAEALVK